jgi:hypothetical protein
MDDKMYISETKEDKTTAYKKNVMLDKVKFYLTEGRKSKEICDMLNITDRTYYNYLKDLRKTYNDTPKYDEAVIRVIETHENLLYEAILISKLSKTINEKIQANYLVSKMLKDLKDIYFRFGLIPSGLKKCHRDDLDGRDFFLENRDKFKTII